MSNVNRKNKKDLEPEVSDQVEDVTPIVNHQHEDIEIMEDEKPSSTKKRSREQLKIENEELKRQLEELQVEILQQKMSKTHVDNIASNNTTPSKPVIVMPSISNSTHRLTEHALAFYHLAQIQPGHFTFQCKLKKMLLDSRIGKLLVE